MTDFNAYENRHKRLQKRTLAKLTSEQRMEYSLHRLQYLYERSNSTDPDVHIARARAKAKRQEAAKRGAETRWENKKRKMMGLD